MLVAINERHSLCRPLHSILKHQGKPSKTKTNKQKYKKNTHTQEFIYCKVSGEGFIVKNVCYVLLPATTSLKMPFVKKIILWAIILWAYLGL